MNQIDQAALDYFMARYPGASITMRPFLGGRLEKIGIQPHDWSGRVIDVGDPWERTPSAGARSNRGKR